MSWAASRRAIILAVIGVVVLLVIGGFAYLSLHKAPSCHDGKQNQNEEGIDCGGVCTYLCTANVIPPVVSFVRALPQASGRTDIIAYVKNPNPGSAAKGVHYTIELYDRAQTVIAKKDGTVDLAPTTNAVIYIPNFYAGTATVDRAFLSFDDASFHWFRYAEKPMIPLVQNPVVSGDQNAPRITVNVTNPFPTTLKGIKLVATVFNADENAMAASQTVVSELAPQETTQAVFTWNTPFADPVFLIEVRPIITLPNP